MEWREFVLFRPGSWRVENDQARYDDVSETFFPPRIADPGHTESTVVADRELRERMAAAHRRLGVDDFVVMRALSPDLPLGTTRTEWTGVLLDLEIIGTEADENNGSA
jgi:hypothetical protein